MGHACSGVAHTFRSAYAQNDNRENEGMFSGCACLYLCFALFETADIERSWPVITICQNRIIGMSDRFQILLKGDHIIATGDKNVRKG